MTRERTRAEEGHRRNKDGEPEKSGTTWITHAATTTRTTTEGSGRLREGITTPLSVSGRSQGTHQSLTSEDGTPIRWIWTGTVPDDQLHEPLYVYIV